MFSDFTVRGVGRSGGETPELAVGNHCHFGSRIVFSVACGIDVGDHVLIAGGSSIADSDEYDGRSHDGTRTEASAARPESSGPKPVILESYAWLGRNAHVLKGVRVGRGAIVAAGSVVNQDVPPGALAMGVPARILKR
jgi:acetyltransferase-like isoleucine patch superfamily enzyme